MSGCLMGVMGRIGEVSAEDPHQQEDPALLEPLLPLLT
jgi:hypothetical protein